MRKELLQYLTALTGFVILLSVSLVAQTSAPGNELGSKFQLLPIPKKIEVSKEKGATASQLTSVFADGFDKKPVLGKNLSSLKQASSSGNGVITLKISSDDGVPESKEGYVLEIKNGQASIAARDKAGIFYGCQTLSQLIQDAKDQKVSIPACKITDSPDIDYRAIHLDLKHHIDSLSYYYNMIDRLAEVKVNAVIIEFEDKLAYKKASIVGASNAISIEDFAALSDYAADRNIEISPLVQGLGHASFILKHPEYKELRDDTASDWSFDPLNPKTYEVQFALYEDAIAATPHGKYLHIGGDEVGKLGMSDLAKKSGKKPFELQMYWLNKVCQFATEHNRIPIFWDDMVFKLSDLYETTYDPSIPKEEVQKRWKEKEQILNENVHLFPKNCVYMRWNYDNPDLPGNLEAIKWYKSHNLAVMAATSGQQIWAMLPRANSNFQPVKDFTRITSEEKLNGILLTLWDDASPVFETYWRGIYDYALFSWNYTDVNKEKAHAMFRHRFYGPSLTDPYYNFEDSLEVAASFWETALINNGARETYPEKIDTLNLPDPSAVGEWTKKNSGKISAAHRELATYQAIKQKISKALSLAQRNKYALQVFGQLNELQRYPAELLVRLEKYDNAKSAEQKKAAAAEVRTYADNFSAVRKNYEDVITKTRVLHNPQDYLLDENHHHHLANGTISSDWMYVYELALNNSIKKAFNE
jgi:hexosaminidase